MAQKSIKTSPAATIDNTDVLGSDESFVTPRCVSLSVVLNGTPPGPGEFNFFSIFNGMIILEGKWFDGATYDAETLPINLKEPQFQTLVANRPLIFLLRGAGGKGSKDPDPLAHPENRAGVCVDLFPLVLGEENIFITSHLVSITTGEITNCSVEVSANSPGEKNDSLIPLILTMISAHCLPAARDGTFYLSAIGLNGIHIPKAINFSMSLSSSSAEKVVFATACNAGFAANTAMNVPREDKFLPNDLELRNTHHCRSVYWNAMRRVLVDAEELYERLSSPFMIEVAGVPRSGKLDVRGRYMGLVDAKVLLEPGQMGVTICSKLLLYNEDNTPDHIGALLELPPTSAKKQSARETDNIFDEHGHNTYVVIRLDLMESLVPKIKLAELYEIIGFAPPEGPDALLDHFDSEVAVYDPMVDARHIRKEGGALAVHKELSGLACKGMIPMNQGIKRTAANRLLMRVRAMLKSFPPGECSYIDWEDTVTGQHAACRRAVTASFAPQPPPYRLSGKVAAARCRIVGDTRIADKHITTNLKVAGNHPRSLIAKTLRCLEERNDVDGKNYLFEALSNHTRNRYLLWILGGLEYDQANVTDIGGAALRIAVKGDCSDGTANAIGWAALHAFHHHNGNLYAAFVAAKKMRKAFSLPTEWNKILERWTEISGEEEMYWMPEVIESDNPILIAAAFFLCLRCYKFCERLLQCVEQNCAGRGSRLKFKMCTDVYYLRTASLILRRQPDDAMEMTLEGIKRFGPSPIMSQMRTTCLSCVRYWDRECELALKESEKAGSVLGTSLLYSSASSRFKFDPKGALQRVARAHKAAPSAHTAFLIGRIYAKMGDEWLAERWLAAAVKTEPLLSDGWAMLALMAMYDRNLNKARIMLRTARQVGPLSPDIEEEVKKVMDIVELDQLPDFLVRNLCLCYYY